MPETRHIAEHRLLTAGWRNPTELARVCDAFNLRFLDFADRLTGITVEYLRGCAEEGLLPTLAEAVAALDAKAVPHEDDELYSVLQDTPVPHGVTLTDLAQAVQQGADARTNELCRALARDAFRALSHTFACPDCIRCSRRTAAPRARREWRPQYEPSNAS